MFKRCIIKIVSFIIITVFILPVTLYAAPPAPSVKAPSAILVDARRGQILYQKYSGTRIHVSIASKIMTALITAEKAKLDAKVTISKDSTNAEGSSLYLEVGEKYSVEDLLIAIMLSPANDAPNALAEFVGGDTQKFVDLMNNKAKALNMKNTNFTNASGLYDQAQYTTAYDLAILIRDALSNPVFNTIFSYKAKPWESGNKTQILVNSNKLFWSYDGVDGGKAGYNEKKQQCAITTATHENMRLISIVLDSPEDSVFNDSIKLFDYGFTNFKTDVLVFKGQVLKTTSIADQEVHLITLNDVYYTFPIGDNHINDVEFSITGKPDLPITKNTVIGTAKYALKDNTVIDINLYSDREIYPPSNLARKISEKFSENKDIYMLVVLLLIVEILLLLAAVSRFVFKKIRKKQA